MWWRFGLFLGKLLGLKFVVRETMLPVLESHLASAMLVQLNPYCVADALHREGAFEEKMFIVKLDNCNWLTALVLRFCSS